MKIVFLTGAGISAESGIPTFRDADGLWQGHDVRQVASVDGWQQNPALMLDFYNERRQAMLSVEPNSAHRAIALLEQYHEVVVVTQNIDDLHECAGSSHVIHLHGELSKVCSSADKETCIQSLPYDHPIRFGDQAEDGSQLRPYIVWFGEDVPNIAMAIEEVASADVFVVIGTSLEVQPAASLVLASRAQRNFIIDPAAPKEILEEMDPTLRVLNMPATEGMRQLGSLLYNLGITEDSLSRQEVLDPSTLQIVSYSRPHDTCQGRELHLANMAGGFSHEALGHTWKSTEYLYLLGEWSLGTPEHLAIQQDVLTATSGYAAKRYKKTKHKRQIRPDFPTFRLDWMLWCIWQKCLGSEDFRRHLLSFPEDMVIVECVKKDPIWAAWPDEQGLLHGGNAVGKCLTICRRCLIQGTTPRINTALLNSAHIHILGQLITF